MKLLVLFMMSTSCALFSGEEGPGQQLLPLAEDQGATTRFGGWLDAMYLDSDDQYQPEYAELSHVHLYLDSRLNNRWRLMLGVNYLNPPVHGETDPEGSTHLQRAYLEYRYGISLKFRLGRFYTPAGLWRRKQGMLMVDNNREPVIEAMNWLPELVEGLEVFGQKNLSWVGLDYSIFLARDQGLQEPGQNHHAPGLGLDFGVTLDERYRFGLFGNHFRNTGSGLDQVPGEREGLMLYSENHFFRHRLLLRAEYLHISREGLSNAGGFYGKARYQTSRRSFLNYRFDHADDLEFGGLHDVQSLTFGFHPTPRLRTRLELATHKLEQMTEPRYNEWSIWIGYLFDFHLK